MELKNQNTFLLKDMEPSNLYSDLKGKHILVVGASSGIGRTLSLALSELGCQLVLCSRNIESDTELSRLDNVKLLNLNITEEENYKSIFQEFEAFDGVCITAGITQTLSTKLLSRKVIHKVMDVNVISQIFLISSLFKLKKLNISSSIIFTSSTSRGSRLPMGVSYAASKAAIAGMVASFRADFTNDENKIRVNSVSFDYVDTGMIDSVQNPDVMHTVGVQPVQNTSLPYIYLLSDASCWVSGINVAADAGRFLGIPKSF